LGEGTTTDGHQLDGALLEIQIDDQVRKEMAGPAIVRLSIFGLFYEDSSH
jgi:hypothetical protein